MCKPRITQGQCHWWKTCVLAFLYGTVCAVVAQHVTDQRPAPCSLQQTNENSSSQIHTQPKALHRGGCNAHHVRRHRCDGRAFGRPFAATADPFRCPLATPLALTGSVLKVTFQMACPFDLESRRLGDRSFFGAGRPDGQRREQRNVRRHRPRPAPGRDPEEPRFCSRLVEQPSMLEAVGRTTWKEAEQLVLCPCLRIYIYIYMRLTYFVTV